MLDLLIIALAYVGRRTYLKDQASRASIEEPTAADGKDPADGPSLALSARRELITSIGKDDVTSEERTQYLKMSGVSIGAAVLRMLDPSPLTALIFLGSYAYTTFPFYRKVEEVIRGRLLKKGECDYYLLAGASNVLLLSLDRYVTASIAVGMAYWGDVMCAKAKEVSDKNLTADLFDSLFDPSHKVWLVRDDGGTVEVLLKHVRQGDVIAIASGETIPVDGVVLSGEASVDQHAFTGESYPVEKGVGDDVFASTLMLTGTLHVRVEQSGPDTALGKMANILTHAERVKTDIQLRGEQLAESANLPFLLLGGAGLFAYGREGAAVILGANTIQGIRTTAPLATVNYQSVAARHHILVKQGQDLERIRSIDTFLFDKTGTLTDGQLKVCGLHVLHPDYGERDILFHAALAEQQLTHPIAKAIMEHARQAGVNVDHMSDLAYKLGYGVTVEFKGQPIRVGSARFMEAEGVYLSETVTRLQADIHAKGHSLVMVAVNDDVAGVIELQTTVRPEAKATFEFLRGCGIKHISIVSGDHTVPTQRLSEMLSADSFFAEVLPADKAGIVKRFQAQGRTVCFVGDGVNDTIAMQQADLSISLHGGTALAMDVADVILVDPNLDRLRDLWELSLKLDANIKRGMGICYTGMGIAVMGTILVHIHIMTVLIVHFVLGSAALGNAMLPLLEKTPMGDGSRSGASPVPDPDSASNARITGDELGGFADEHRTQRGTELSPFPG